MTINTLETIFEKAANAPSTELVKALRSSYIDGSVSKLALSGFLDRHIKEFEAEGQRICDSQEIPTPSEKNAITLIGQMIASNIILLLEMRSYEAIRTNLLTFLNYASHVVKSSYDFVGTAVKAMSFNLSGISYDWTTIENAMSLDILAHNICNNSNFSKKTLTPFLFEGNGQVTIDNGCLSIKSSPCGDNGVTAFSLCGGAVKVVTRSARDERLKSSEANDAEKLEAFARTFMHTQEDSGRVKLPCNRQSFKPGDTVTLKYLRTEYGDDGYPIFYVEIFDSLDQIVGTIKDEELIKGLYTEDLDGYFLENDCIPNAVISDIDGDHYIFSIKDSYRAFAERQARIDERYNNTFKAKVIDIDTRYERINWMTPSGYGALSFILDGVKKGDTKVMSLYNIQKKNNDIYINICEPKYGYDHIDKEWDDNAVLEEYVIEVHDALEALKSKKDDNANDEKQKNIIRTLASILRGNVASGSLDAYKCLLCSSFLSLCVRDTPKLTLRDAAYLKCCIEYAQTGDIGHVGSGLDFSKEQGKILSCLKLSGHPEKIHSLASIINENGLDDLGNQVVSLVLADSISQKFPDEIKTTDSSLRRKICELLGVADQFREEEQAVYGKYGKGEGSCLEFKSSYVFRNDIKNEKVADIDYQGRGQVFEAACGFLNTDGGVIYLGVNDKTGDPITNEEYGLKADMKWLTDNFDTIKVIKSKKLGHAITKPDSIDHMVLFLNAEKELYFKESLLNNITIEATEDQDAIRISVTPSRFEIAYLYKDKERIEGIAYKRDGNTTKPMTHHDMEQRMMTLMDISKPARFIVKIQDAINKKNRLIFHRYSSGNSGVIRDRHVVPVNLFYNNENVYCWDLDECRMKQFRLSRIESIDVDETNGTYTHSFEPGKADVFRWIMSGKPKHLKIRMEVGALNHLLEEYSNAKNLPKEELYEEPSGKWILDTHIQGFGAIRRFYLGLADKIEIIDTEDSDEFKAEIARFVKENLDGKP